MFIVDPLVALGFRRVTGVFDASSSKTFHAPQRVVFLEALRSENREVNQSDLGESSLVNASLFCLRELTWLDTKVFTDFKHL